MQSCYADKETWAIADLCDYYGTGMIITRINVPAKNRGQGHARALLKRILDDADREGVALFLEISPSDGLSYCQLRSWYERHGFRSMRGVYVRKPQKGGGDKE